jgi:nucleoside recognition membrane protein YjiH
MLLRLLVIRLLIISLIVILLLMAPCSVAQRGTSTASITTSAGIILRIAGRFRASQFNDWNMDQ